MTSSHTLRENTPEMPRLSIHLTRQSFLRAKGYWWWSLKTSDGDIGWSAEGDSSKYFIEPLPCSIEALSHYNHSRGGFVLEILQNPLPGEFRIYYNGLLVPDTETGVQHNGFAGEPTDNSVFLGISTRFAKANPGVLIIIGVLNTHRLCRL